MKNTKHTIKLSKKEQLECHSIIKKGIHKARVMNRARILIRSDEGIAKDALAKELHIGRSTVQRTRDRFRNGRLKYALFENKRPGQPKKLDAKKEAHLIALACSHPPYGSDHWTLALLQEQMIKDKQVKTISSVAIMHYLHANDLKPWREKNVVHTNAHA